MRRGHFLCAVALLLSGAYPVLSAAAKVPVPRPKPGNARYVNERALSQKPEPLPDISHAIPAKDIVGLPSTAEQFRSLKKEIAKTQPAVASAKEKSDALKAEALLLQQKLVATARRVEELESEKVQLDTDIEKLTAEDKALSASFARDRVSVARLLAILERLQHDMPPAMVLHPDDALGAARGAMLIGASLPSVYGEAAALSLRIDKLQKTRLTLIARRAEGQRNAVALAQARGEIDQLLAIKELEADAAATRYGALKTRLDSAAVQAGDLAALLTRIAQLRAQPAQQNIVVVTAKKDDMAGFLHKGMLLRPAVGELISGGLEGIGGARAPGITFATAPGAQVIAPADGEVLFAGPYHKSGQVLILELTAGYDVVLAGMERVNVRPGYQLLAGEPVGTMPKINQEERLYFELRQNGHGISPAPWLVLELRKAKRS